MTATWQQESSPKLRYKLRQVAVIGPSRSEPKRSTRLCLTLSGGSKPTPNLSGQRRPNFECIVGISSGNPALTRCMFVDTYRCFTLAPETPARRSCHRDKSRHVHRVPKRLSVPTC